MRLRIAFTEGGESKAARGRARTPKASRKLAPIIVCLLINALRGQSRQRNCRGISNDSGNHPKEVLRVAYKVFGSVSIFARYSATDQQ